MFVFGKPTVLISTLIRVITHMYCTSMNKMLETSQISESVQALANFAHALNSNTNIGQ